MTGQIGYFELIGFGEHGWGFLLLKAMFMTIAIAFGVSYSLKPCS